MPIEAAAIVTRLEAARAVYGELDLVVAPSAALARDYARFGLPTDRTVVIDYGFEPMPDPPPAARAPGPLRIGFAGTLAWHKGAHLLLEAVRALPPDRYEVRIAGDTAVFPDYTETLREAARGLPVIFAGRFDRHEAASVYGTFDVLVVPSLWPENSPLVIHEAFMMGVPVVGARAGGIPDLVEDGVSGLLFDTAVPATLSAALRRLIDEPALLPALRAGRPPVRSIAEDAAWWGERYRALASARQRRPA
jgi:glycosyltransferase involved in cell wall biosynthesis